MKNKFRRVLSIAIAIIMVVSMMPMAFAADETNVAAIGEIEYASIKAAVAAANDGDTITVIADYEIENSEFATSAVYAQFDSYVEILDKAVTIDFNGKKVTANPELENDISSIFFVGATGSLTLKDSSEAQNGGLAVTMGENTQAYSLIFADGNQSKLSIEGGDYYIDKIEGGYSMIYAAQTGTSTVSGGNFVLGNVEANVGQGDVMIPWIFNTYGNGMNFVEVTGGTYNANPQNHWDEVVFPGCYKAVENEDATWSVVLEHTPGEEATCFNAQYCTVCNEELAAALTHKFENYVSNGDATCSADGTKTAECIYGCGATDTVVEENTAVDHTDADEDSRCDFCNAKFCDTCGKIHKDWMSELFCLIIEFIRLLTSFIVNVF